MTRLLVLACAAFVAAAGGCGYHAGAMVRPDVRSVHVKMFDNRDFRHEIEIPLTQAVKDEIARRTHLKIADAESADSTLGGSITRIKASVVTYDQGDRVFSQNLTVTVAFEWKRRGGESLARVPEMSETVSILAPRGDSQGAATSDAFRQLAQRIVERMQEDF